MWERGKYRVEGPSKLHEIGNEIGKHYGRDLLLAYAPGSAKAKMELPRWLRAPECADPPTGVESSE